VPRHSSHGPSSLPYLAALGPLPIRFARPGPEPTAEAPASPEPKVVETTPSTGPAKTPEPVSAPVVEKQPEQLPVEETPITPEPMTQPPLPILPDDTARELRPEDVLPFFRYPSASVRKDGVRISVPLSSSDQSQSAPPPASSATYEIK
jgi:hypothetical protein